MTASHAVADTPHIAMRSFSASLPMALLKAREAAMCRFRPLLGERDLTEQQWRVLRALVYEENGIDVGALVGATSLLAPSLTRILANLEQRGFIDRGVAADDLRRSVISLSHAGRALVATIAPESELVYSSIEERFGAPRLRALMVELDELAELLHETEG